MDELQNWAEWLDTCAVPDSAVRDIVPGDTGNAQTEPIGAMLDFRDPDGTQLEVLFVDTAKVQQAGFGEQI